MAGGYGQDYHYNLAGTGSDRSTWQFPDLPAGTYEILVTWLPNPGRASNAPYSLYAPTLVRTEQVNQLVAPQQDAQLNGVWFESLGTVSLDSSGAVQVVLTDNANGIVIADAVWVRLAQEQVSDVIDDGDARHELEGTWSLGGLAGGYEQDYRWSQAGNGSDRSIWQFQDLPVGTYEVLVTWLANTGRATNAPKFELYAPTLVRTVEVNQQLAPQQDAELSGVWFESLGMVSVDSSGVMEVVLTDNANGIVIADAVWVRSVSFLMATDEVSAGSTSGQTLTEADLTAIYTEAVALWAATGLPEWALAKMQRVEIVIADLQSTQLGIALTDRIYLDRDAAGHGWFLDETPGMNEEFAAVGDNRSLLATTEQASSGMDLLTVVMHELGHLVGLEDLSDSNSLMNRDLSSGVRRAPSEADVDAVFATWNAGFVRSRSSARRFGF